MPTYAFLDRPLSYGDIGQRVATLRSVGVPYTDAMVANARADLETQARPAEDGAAFAARYGRARQMDPDGNEKAVTEMDALVAYLQMLGTLVDFSEVTPERLRQQ